jgi:hypothetical protein
MIFKTIKEGFEYFSKFNKPKQRRWSLEFTNG